MRTTPRRSHIGSWAGDGFLADARYEIPPEPSIHVTRPHLLSALDAAGEVPLVVVSAPAGTGKTAGVAEWARAHRAGTTCWVGFDEEGLSFWDAVLESLRRHGLGIPTSWTVPPGKVLGPKRLNALVGLVVGAPRRLTVVVDGHVLDSLEIAHEVDRLLRRSLGRLGLVFVGRVDPVLPMYRYRLEDSVREIRAPDLAFSDDEAGRLLRSTGVNLSDHAIHDLNRRLSGWVAGLRFAARALTGRPDAEAYAASVVEQTTDINEYLVREVLDAQPPEVRRILLDTCVTEAFSTDLVELIGGASAVHAVTDVVDRRAFVEAVPGRTDLFHYYPFFRNLLLAELAYESPERLAELRRIASRWYRELGRDARSLDQLARIGDWRSVATQIVDDGLVSRILLEEQGGSLGAVARQMPSDVTFPAAHVVRAATALRNGEAPHERCARELASARRALRHAPAAPGVQLAIAVTDAFRGCVVDDAAKAAALTADAERWLAGAPGAIPGRHAADQESVVASAAGIVALRLGDLAGAGTKLGRAVDRAPVGTAAALQAERLGRLAVADALSGELAAAIRHAQEALTTCSQAGLGHHDLPPSAHVALAWVGVERCDPDLTAEHVTAARSSPLLAGDQFSQSLVEAATAALEQSTGQVRSAIDRLETAADASATGNPWLSDQLRVEAARLNLREGDPEHALEVLKSTQFPDRPEVSLTMAAALPDEDPPPGLTGLARDESVPVGLQVRALLVDAAHAARRNGRRQAVPTLCQALRLGAKERLRRPFQESDPVVQQLLAAEPRLAERQEWLRRPGADSGPGRASRDRPGLPIVVDALTPKEFEVLSQMEELLTTEEIAQRLFVSVNTVRTHIRHILRKLGVDRRNAAIRRARDLGILDS